MAIIRALGRSGEDAAGIDQAVKLRIDSITGTAAYRTPDALTETTLTEIKNVGYLRVTDQILDYMYWASDHGLTFELVVRSDTVFARGVDDLVTIPGSPLRVLRLLPPGG